MDSASDWQAADFPNGLTAAFGKRRFISWIRVAGEGTKASFSTALATRVLEKFGSPLALPWNCLLFFVGLRALA